MSALEKKNNTWEIMDLPIGKKQVGCKWVFIVKYRENETLGKYKARLIANRYTLTYRINYILIAKMNTIHTFLFIVINFDWSLHHFDMNNAFPMGI